VCWQSQRQELAVIANDYGLTGSIATHAGSVIGAGGVIVAVRATPTGRTASIAAAIASELLSLTSSYGDIKSRLLSYLVADPPESSFRRVARPASVRGFSTTIRPGKGVSSASAATLSEVLRSMSRDIEFSQAIVTATDRASGAADAGNAASERTQLAAAAKYARDDAKVLDVQPRLFAAVARVLRTLPAGRSVPTARDYAAFRAALKAKGFTAAYSTLERRLGVSASELKLQRAEYSRGPEPPRRSAAAIFGDGNLAKQVRTEAKLLRAFASAAPQAVAAR